MFIGNDTGSFEGRESPFFPNGEAAFIDYLKVLAV